VILDSGLLYREEGPAVLRSAMHMVNEHESIAMTSANVNQRQEAFTGGISPWRVSPADRPPLRIGLLLDSAELSLFSARIIEDIRASNFAKLELLVFRKATTRPATNPPARTPLGSLRRRIFDSKLRQRALYNLYLRLDKRMKPANHPLDKIDGSDLLAGIESIEVEPAAKKFVDRFPEPALQEIRSKNLDVILRFGFNILHGDILKAARYGVWSYHHGDNDYYRGGPAHFWELQEGSPLSGVILQVLTEELDGGFVLCKSLFTTQPTISMSANRYAPYWGSTDFVIRKLNELHRFGWEHLEKNAVPRAPYQGKRKLYRRPTNVDMIRWLGPALLKKAIRYPFPRRNVQHWQIGIRLRGNPLFESGHDLEGFRWIDAPTGHFWADPFGFEHGGRNWVFFEDYSYQKKRGWIACAAVSSDGSLMSPTPCLENPDRHYSYPHVFRAGSDIFMVPESYDSQRVDLFRCQEFPSKWAHERSIFQGQFVDTTIWQHDGLWWLMTTRAEPDPRAGCLLLFYSESLTGEWQFHPANPISTDSRNNRGAGRVFRAENRLIRPSQSRCPIYGYSFSLNEITKLTPEDYSEQVLTTVTPEFWDGFCAVHTYNRVGNIELIDGARMTRLKDVLPDPGRRGL
jgi:hypothetical protein